ncbi:helix-turn-helix domain-containing protein [Paracoccus actinidiae]|uniref:helix-turn-helix domain-containing protein n=1 Tax=Paracoccus actinidiae TaxID=3064531 RepID=UPI0027D313D4|nr:helix-turn-helix domain-containing protein [Paracoccus sp. M09]
MASHLTLPERRIVAAMLQRKISVAQIAVKLGPHRSTIHRENRRNFWHNDEVPMATGYDGRSFRNASPDSFLKHFRRM